VLEHISKQYQDLLPILGLVAVLLMITIGILSAIGRKKAQSDANEPLSETQVEQKLGVIEPPSETMVISRLVENAHSEPIANAEAALAPPTVEELAMAELIAEAGEAAALASAHDEPVQEQIRFIDESKSSWEQAVKESLQRRLGRTKANFQNHSSDPGFIVINVMGHRSMKYLGTTLTAILKAQGLVLNDKQVFEFKDDNGVDFIVASAINPGIFPMSSINTFTTPGLSFILDLAQVKQPKHAFVTMLKLVNEIATELEGDILDEHRQRLTQSGMNEYMLRIQTAENLRESEDA